MDMFTSKIKLMQESLVSEDFERLYEYILKAEHIHLYGSGRSLNIIKCFGMRLMHLGFPVIIVGSTTSPHGKKSDVLICMSGSGNTVNVITAMRIAKENNIPVVLFTHNKSSEGAKLADLLININTGVGNWEAAINDPLEVSFGGDYSDSCVAPMGTVFEILMLCLLDSIINKLMMMLCKDCSDLEDLHSLFG